MKYEVYSGKYEPTATTAYSIDVRRRLVSRQVQLGNETRKLNATKIAHDRSAKDGKLLHLLQQKIPQRHPIVHPSAICISRFLSL